MSHAQNWVEALNINPESLEAWSQEVPPGTPLLVWCIEQGYVSSDAYLAWATENFGAPILQSSFFEQIALERAPFQTQRELWHPWCFPISEWEGTSYLVCLEIPNVDERAENTCYILGDLTAMKHAWTSSAGPVDTPIGFKQQTKKFELNLDMAALLPGDESTHAPSEPATPEFTPDVEPIAFADHGEGLLGEATVARLTPVNVAPTPLKPADEQVLLSAVNGLVPTYAQACVLRFGADGKAWLYKWSTAMKPAGEKVVFDLNEPSFLRIVAKTVMPYHGYLVDSPTHHKFIESFGLSQLPGCVTAVPVKIDEKLWGVVLGFGELSVQTTDNLNAVISVADLIVAKLGPALLKAA